MNIFNFQSIDFITLESWLIENVVAVPNDLRWRLFPVNFYTVPREILSR
jgi:hypothetical protein